LQNKNNLQETLIQIHEVRDPNWRPHNTALYQLFITDNMLVSVIFDKETQKFVYLKSFPADTPLSALQENAGTLFDDGTPQSLNIFVTTPKTALIPEELYESEAQESFFTLNHPLEEYEIVYEQKIDRLNAVMLFAITSEMETAFNSLDLEWNLYHADACWLEALLMLYKESEGPHVHVDFQPAVMSIAVYRDGALQLYNTFVCDTPEDRLYFVMFISEQLRISPQKDNYFLSGQINRSDDTYMLFARYIAKMQMQTRPDFYRYALPFHELPEHFYFKAYCSALCE
jgi:hypothetical protein